MRVMVTGHGGYIGAVLAPMLVEAGHDVVGLDTGLFDSCDFGPPRRPVTAIRKDIRDVDARDLAGFDAVAHLAALSNDPLGDLRPQLTYEINHGGTMRVAEAAKQAGVRRFLFASSCSLYGTGGDALLDEQAPTAPVTAYGESKILAERDLAGLADDGFSPVFLRNATAYGSSPRLRLDIVVNNLMGWAVTTGKVRILSDGSPWRPLVHVQDICNAFMACLTADRDRIHNQTFNIGRNGANYRIREVAEIVGSIVPDSEVTFAEGGEPDTRNYKVDFSKAASLLEDFAPSWTVELGAGELFEAYSAHGLTDDVFGADRYVRLRRVQSLRDSGRLDENLEWLGEEAER